MITGSVSRKPSACNLQVSYGILKVIELEAFKANFIKFLLLRHSFHGLLSSLADDHIQVSPDSCVMLIPTPPHPVIHDMRKKQDISFLRGSNSVNIQIAQR